MLLPLERRWIGSSTLLGERLRRVFVVVEGRTGRGPRHQVRRRGRASDGMRMRNTNCGKGMRSAGLAVGQVERKQDEGGMARGWAERETFAARGASRSTQLPNSRGVPGPRPGRICCCAMTRSPPKPGKIRGLDKKQEGAHRGGVGIKVGHYQETPRLHESKINQKRAILAQLQVRERDE